MDRIFDLVASGGVTSIVAAVAVGVLVYAFISHRRDRRRREALFALAVQRGWNYSRRDPFGLLGLPFALFRKGDGRGVENVVHGTDGDDPVRVFDYWYYTETRNREGTTSRTYHRFSCAVLPLPGVHAPHLRIEPENVLSRLGDAVGLRDQQFESEEFNRRYQVTCGDPRFASAAIDARMMRWLLDVDGRFRFELRGPRLLVASDRIDDPAQFVLLHEVATLFRARLPAVTASLYPAPASASGSDRGAG